MNRNAHVQLKTLIFSSFYHDKISLWNLFFMRLLKIEVGQAGLCVCVRVCVCVSFCATEDLTVFLVCKHDDSTTKKLPSRISNDHN